MSAYRVLAVALFAALIEGCGPTLQAGPVTQIATQDDRFQPYRELRSSPVTLRAYPNIISYTLTARIDRKTSAVTMGVEVTFVYVAQLRRYYNAARNARAESLRLVPIRAAGRCSRNPCPHEEIFAVEIPESDLRQAPAEGYALKIFARSGPEAVITIGKDRIGALLAEVDAARRLPARG
jgi:hypothetical protein